MAETSAMTASQQIENRIYGHGPGWVFSPADFLDLGSPHTVGMALIRMVREGQIRRLARELYELVEINPKAIRIRKRHLKEFERKKANRAA